MTSAQILSLERDISAFLSKSDLKFNEFQDRLAAMEQHAAHPTGSAGFSTEKSPGHRVVDSENFKSMVQNGARSSGRIDVGSFKTAIVSGTGVGQALVAPEFYPGISFPSQQRLTVRDLLPVVPTSSNMIEYTVESSFTNNAAMQGAGSSPQVFENVAKPESAATYQLLYAPVQTLAHWLPISKQIMDDSAALRGYINARMVYGLKLAEEGQLLNGTGTGASLKG